MKKLFAVSQLRAHGVARWGTPYSGQLASIAPPPQIDMIASRILGPNALLLLISYDTTTPDRPQKFEALDKTIKEGTTETPLRPLHSVWLVKTEEDIGVWGARLGEHLSPDDRLIIARISGMASVNGWLPPVQWEWIKERVG